MPTIEENLEYWSSYEWPEEGDEWSAQWGGTGYLWYGTIFPRIQGFLPTGSILEIAPGYGRCTQYLLTFCRELTLVDLTERCIESCRKKFQSYKHIAYFVNDGKSLDMIPDHSVDFVFSWDSLVHAESDILLSYMQNLQVKMRPGSYGFIHHSNFGAFRDPATGAFTVENRHWRGATMTAAFFRECCVSAGLACVSQELIGWGGEALQDCFSVFVKDPSFAGAGTHIVENPDFMSEAFRMKKIYELYDPNCIRKRSQAGSFEGKSS